MAASLEEIARDLAMKAIEGNPTVLAGPDAVKAGRYVGDVYQEILKAVIAGNKTLPK
jgi:hypothetical protein